MFFKMKPVLARLIAVRPLAERIDESTEPSLNALISFALAEANWAERSIHPTMTPLLRRQHELHAHMNFVIARRLQELKSSR